MTGDDEPAGWVHIRDSFQKNVHKRQSAEAEHILDKTLTKSQDKITLEQEHARARKYGEEDVVKFPKLQKRDDKFRWTFPKIFRNLKMKRSKWTE